MFSLKIGTYHDKCSSGYVGKGRPTFPDISRICSYHIPDINLISRGDTWKRKFQNKVVLSLVSRSALQRESRQLAMDDTQGAEEVSVEFEI